MHATWRPAGIAGHGERKSLMGRRQGGATRQNVGIGARSSHNALRCWDSIHFRRERGRDG